MCRRMSANTKCTPTMEGFNCIIFVPAQHQMLRYTKLVLRHDLFEAGSDKIVWCTASHLIFALPDSGVLGISYCMCGNNFENLRTLSNMSTQHHCYAVVFRTDLIDWQAIYLTTVFGGSNLGI